MERLIGQWSAQKMEHALWVSKKNQICNLVKKISDHHGGDDIIWLREYCREIIHKNRDDLNSILEICYELEEQLKYIPRRAHHVSQGTS